MTSRYATWKSIQKGRQYKRNSRLKRENNYFCLRNAELYVLMRHPDGQVACVDGKIGAQEVLEIKMWEPSSCK